MTVIFSRCEVRAILLAFVEILTPEGVSYMRFGWWRGLDDPVAVFEAFAAQVQGGLDVDQELVVDGFYVEAGFAF
jgi:hypothetical protein